MDFLEIKGKQHYLYNDEEEFRALGNQMPLRHYWRDGSEGEWVKTDDDYVCQILRKIRIGKKDCIRTVCGTFDINNKYFMNGEDGIADNIYSFSGKQTTGFSERPTKGQFLFAQYVAQGVDVIEAYKKAYPKAKSELGIQKQVNKLLKVEHVKKMIKDEIQNCLNEEGVTAEWIIGRYKTIADLAENDNAKLRSLDSLAKMSGLFEPEIKKSEQVTIWAGFSPEQLEEVKKDGKSQIIAHAEKDKED